MASSGNDPTQGFPLFDVTDAPDDGADQEILAAYAAFRGNMLRGTTSQRNFFEYDNEGVFWSDTTDGHVYFGLGLSGWKDLGDPNSAWVTIASGTAPATGSFGSGWSAPSNSGRRAGSAKKDGDRVYIEGVFTKASSWLAGDTFLTLPTGFAPVVSVDVPFRLGANIIQVFARANGTLTVQEAQTGGGSIVPLGGASWARD